MKIPNNLTFALLPLGLVAQTLFGEGFLFAISGASLAFVLHFILWQMKLEGAGDAKLMMGVGAFVGWPTMLEATLWRYVLLLPYAVIVLTVLGRWGNFRSALQWTAQKSQGLDVGERPAATHVPFGPLIAVAVPLAVHSTWLGFFG